MGTRWRGLLAPIDQPTGDGRRMAPGSMRSRELPLALKWQRSDEPGHDNSVVVGMVDKLDFKDDGVWGEGELFDDADPGKMPRMAEDVAEVMHLLESKVIGPSVDAGSATAMEVVEGTSNAPTEAQWAEIYSGMASAPKTEIMFTDYEIAAATLVPIPAFAEARPFDIMPMDDVEDDDDDECPDGHHLEDGECVADDENVYALTASVTGSTDLPIADRDMAWDGPAAASRVFDKFTNADGKLDVPAVSRAFLYRDSDSDPQNRGSYKLGFADIVDGTLSIVPRGVAATAGGRGVRSADVGSDQSAIESKICTLYGKIQGKFDDWPDCPFSGGASMSVDVVALVAAWSEPDILDAELFADPALKELTPFTYNTDTGHVYGHLAPSGACHVGYKESCVSPPESLTSYSLFHRYVVNSTAGLMEVGRITTGHGEVGPGCDHKACSRMDDHACGQFSFNEAVAHHDRMRTLAQVQVGTDEHGIWFSGRAEPGLSEADIRVMSRQMVSGDWRQHGAGMELTEILALSSQQPGFPVATATSKGGRQFSLVAASPVSPLPAPTVSVEDLADSVADKVLDRLNRAEKTRVGFSVASERLAAAMKDLRLSRGEIASRKASSLTKGNH